MLAKALKQLKALISAISLNLQNKLVYFKE